jgi:hypothetical protein
VIFHLSRSHVHQLNGLALILDNYLHCINIFSLLALFLLTRFFLNQHL